MSCLVDVNVLLAFGWKNHPFHNSCSKWLENTEAFTTCPIVELGFLRVSMTHAFNASFKEAQLVLNSITSMESAKYIACDLAVALVPEVTSYKDTTDAYLVSLAEHHELKLATLDDRILNKQWAAEIAFNPTKEAP
jgi:predicted nucleic acid-binding protein